MYSAGSLPYILLDISITSYVKTGEGGKKSRSPSDKSTPSQLISETNQTDYILFCKF